jgi:exopolyphosphatase/guanosine-5'-triphosphate,3'-diphosphate pyrophosphatase
MIRALVSIGTNSTRLLVLDGRLRIAAESRGTRLGTGITTNGRLDPAARERTLAALDDYLSLARARGAQQIDAISTSVLRRADDGAAFSDDVARRTGIAPRVLSGVDEATYSFLGATATYDGAGTIAVLDVGGGSAELAIDVPARARARGNVAKTISVEIGAVRLSERFPALLGAAALDDAARTALEHAARADAAAVLAAYGEAGRFDTLIAVGGTVFTAAAMVAGGLRDGAQMSAADRRGLIDALLSRDLEGRRRLEHIRPQRADILPAGLIIVDEACRLLGADNLTVSEADLLLGYLASAAYRAAPFPMPVSR